MLCFIVFGFTQVKMSFILAWIDGFVRQKDKSVVNGVVICLDLSVMTIVVAYLLYYSRDVNLMLFWGTVIGVLANMLTLVLIPESPIFYADHFKFDDASLVYHKIAKFNGRKFDPSIRVSDQSRDD
jgi:hypothetical protein